ncbi:transglutaminaseTgpA domain-containing protein [Paenibacillus sp. chi10]|uniref:TransglutaminaseTgpA domain-containing protein n=1 Tax=Paenibacillus suaedae TaxID=3077233 RepID=A0AAJ2JZ27_9BACL|nr:transglutaminaseTgpA domain-containing protein [Paenibacillus sp. chi10]MDT8977064.1 transglutaminaseTgpA domain-containing protein [Paenibacillus sp. chi10]
MKTEQPYSAPSRTSTVQKAADDRIQVWLSSYWTERMIWTCMIVMVWQWLVMLEPYWYDETLAMSRMFMIGLWGAVMLFPCQFIGRLIIALPALCYIVYRNLVQFDIWTDGGERWDKLLQFHPYIWFLLGLWLCCESLVVLVQGKARVLLWLLVQIMIFGILDSFTDEILWMQVAWIVGASLIWLICIHYKQMNTDYPNIWRGSVRYPLQMGLLAVFVISLIISVGVSVPEVKPILTDPYTAWSNRYGDGNNPMSDLVSKVTGSGSGSRTSTSGYSHSDAELGNGFNMDYMPVMSVTTEMRGYWRGESKDWYTGQGWDKTPRRNPIFSLRQQLTAADQPARNIPTRMIQQTITMQNKDLYPVLFGLGMIESVESISNSLEAVLRWNEQEGEVRYEDPKTDKYPTSYTLTSRVPIFTEEDLRKSSQTISTDADRFQRYLQIPNTLPQRVKDLAQELTHDETNYYDKVKKVENYLRTQYRYTNAPNLSLRKSEDFVDAFLFEIKEGYCDHFSTSMAILLRSAGIPTRWVKGYAPGTRQNGDAPTHELAEQSQDSGAGTYQVTNAEAHSWVEVYMGDYGWVAFEPTPGFTYPRLQQEEKKPEPEKKEEQKPEEKQEEKKPEPKQERQDASLPAWLVQGAKWIVIVMAAVCFLLLLWKWRTIGFSLRFFWLLKRNLTYKEQIILHTDLWLSYCRWKGMRKGAHETVREAAKRWSDQREGRSAPAAVIVNKFEQAKYGGHPVMESDVKQLKEAIRAYKHIG